MKKISGFLIAVLVLQLVHNFIIPNIIPGIVSEVYADEQNVEPDGDGNTSQAIMTTCGAATSSSCLDDGLTEPTAPSTSGDYLTFTKSQTNVFTMGSIGSVDTVTDITVWLYYESSASNFNFDVTLYDVNESTTYGGGTQQMENKASPGWGSLTFSSMSLTQSELDDLRINLTCSRTGSGNDDCTAYAMYAEVTYDPVVNVTIGTSSAQQNLDVGSTNQHVGGSFSSVANIDDRTITSVTITENGTVDAQNDLDNIKLYYEFDTTAPYDCVGETFDGTENQYGETDVDGFSGADGTSTFTESILTTTTQTACFYPVLDVLSTAGAGETIEIEISDPTVDVISTGAVISPDTAVPLDGTTVLQKTVLNQENYHWRNDDGDETSSGASSVSGGVENTPNTTFPYSETRRLRMAVSNEGNKTSASTQYRLESAVKVTTCDVATGWTDVGAAGGYWDIYPTDYLTDGNDTTDIAIASGGVTNPETNFLTTNGGQKDTSSQTSGITLAENEFVELEYAVQASTTIQEGTSFCFRVTDAGTPIDSYTNYPVATIAADVTVASLDSQTSLVPIPTTTAYGGAFSLIDGAAGSNDVTSITITAAGTVDKQNDISNIKLRYDYDITAPYDCTGETYTGTETQYGSTVSAFNESNEATFTSASVNISETQALCMYIEYDVDSDASDSETLEFSIFNPSSDVSVTSSTVAPASILNIEGTTQFTEVILEQADYHWRDNTGDETGAGSLTGGIENTVISNIEKNSTHRIRFGVANTGLQNSASTAFRLEWARKYSTCAAATGWTRVDTASDDWAMSSGGNITDGDSSTNIAKAIGGVSDSATTFLTTNYALKDDNDTTTGVVVPSDNFLDLEYSIEATTDALQGGQYCFRLTDNGTPLDKYTNYPEATVKMDTDFKIQHGVSTMTGDTLTITAGMDYDAPNSASSSFIRITNTGLSGAGPDTGDGASNADDVTVYITNPNNILNNIVFQRGASASGNTRISWEIVEYVGAAGGENEIIVRHQDVLTYASANLTVSGATVSSVADDSDVVAFITSQYNPDPVKSSYDLGLSSSAWNTTNSRVDLTRGASGNAAIVSYSLVEFTGSNWKIQRVEHIYSAVNTVETESLTSAVNSLSRTFLHVQKTTDQNTHADYGHQVWLSGIGQVSFMIDADAVSPSTHSSVAWVIENTQTEGGRMVVTRSNGNIPAGIGPETNNMSIGITLHDFDIASIFTNNSSDSTDRTWPEPILGVRLISTTQYELWRSDASANVDYRTEVVEWPTAYRKLIQDDYRLYVDNDALLPTDPWPVGVTNLGENTEMTANDVPMSFGETIRIRMNLAVSAAAMPAGLDSFELEFGERVTTCSAISEADWHGLGEIGSTTAIWRGINNTPTDGIQLSGDPPTDGDLLLALSTVAGTYEEENHTSPNPYTAYPTDEVEYDWVVQNNGASDKTSYCFRMVESDGTLLDGYNTYPVLRTVGYEPVITNWRWYDDETSLTPTIALADENVAPSDVVNQNAIKLRLVLEEISGAEGTNAKFALQYSEYADFSQAVYTLTSTSTCAEDSLWCFYDGSGVDNEIIDSSVISDADSCISGVGSGCGTHNEGTSTASATYDQVAFSSAEYEFTILHAGARANAVYYFRLYDLVNDEVVALDTDSTYPSLVTEGAQLVSTMSAVTANTSIAGIVTDVETTPNSIGFGSVPFNTSYEAAQSLNIDTNATDGYQLFMYATQQPTNDTGDIIIPITSTNASPVGWNSACLSSAKSCFGYHTTDATLGGGDGRFAPFDSYAAIDTNPQEIMYSSIPADDTEYIIYRMWISETQEYGDYQTSIVYIATPIY